MGFIRFVLIFFTLGVISFLNLANNASAEGGTALLDVDKGRS